MQGTEFDIESFALLLLGRVSILRGRRVFPSLLYRRYFPSTHDKSKPYTLIRFLLDVLLGSSSFADCIAFLYHVLVSFILLIPGIGTKKPRITAIMAFRHSKDFMNSFRRSKDLPMLPSYDMLSKPNVDDIRVNIGEISRTSTWETESPSLSRTTTWKKPHDFDVSVRELSRSSTGKTETPEILTKMRRGRRSWAWAIISQVISVLWLVPISVLLVFNFKNYVVGASVWCPRGRCSSDFLNNRISAAMARATQLDREDHDVMGALQFVSKALEVWFMFISTSLIYDVAMLFAKKGGGIPVGFLLTHLEFGDIRYILNPLLWTSPIPHPSGTRERKITAKLYIFVVLAASLTILTNFMGPATAVLAIPTLQWIDTAQRSDAIFNGTEAFTGPSFIGNLPCCTPDDFDHFLYSCTLACVGSSMDAYALEVEPISTQIKMDAWVSNSLPILSQESGVQYALNESYEGDLTWVPNRQSVRDIGWDVALLQNYDHDETFERQDPDMWRYNNSLQTILHRQGVGFGFTSSCYLGNKTTMTVDIKNKTDDREVICYSGWTPYDTSSYNFNGWNDEGSYSKCFMSGYDWSGSANDFTNFYLNDSDSEDQAEVSYYFSSQSLYLDDQNHCLIEGSKNQCNWEEDWTAPPSSEVKNRTANSLITEYKISNPTTPNERRWCDSHIYINYPIYTYDTNKISNPLSLVQMKNLTSFTDLGEPQTLSMAWILAAWSADEGGTIGQNRPIAQGILKSLPAAYFPESKAIDWVKHSVKVQAFKRLHDFTLAQALSFITLVFYDATNSTYLEEIDGPIFCTHASLHVWAYGLSDQTSKLGVAVAFLGCVCVIVRLALAIMYRFRHEHSSVELFVAALNHKSQGEFEGLDDEQELAKVRYEMIEDDEGRPMFVPEKRQNSWESPQLEVGRWNWDWKRWFSLSRNPDRG